MAYEYVVIIVSYFVEVLGRASTHGLRHVRPEELPESALLALESLPNDPGK